MKYLGPPRAGCGPPSAQKRSNDYAPQYPDKGWRGARHTRNVTQSVLVCYLSTQQNLRLTKIHEAARMTREREEEDEEEQEEQEQKDTYLPEEIPQRKITRNIYVC